ncbi:ferritin family protein [Streptomyces sp. NPDC018000]|uniref:ferritin family protein n=1 Tax=Streptomyces sp. NPDC018000 TaxID=3365028 RepID=UPI00379A0169
MVRHSIRTLLVGLCTLTAASQAATAVALVASTDQHKVTYNAAKALAPQTRSDLTTAMKDEAFADAIYSLFGAQADREGHADIGRLFPNTAQTELNEHLREAATLAGIAGGNAANLRQAISGETYENQIMYRDFATRARQDGDMKAADLFTEIAADEGRHRDAFRTALDVLTSGRGTIPVPQKADPVAVLAGLPQVNAARTKANLDTAMHGEALAYAKYMLFAEQAKQSGNPALARLWEGTAAVELNEHLAGEAALAGLVRTTKENLDKAVTGERSEATTIYPGFAKQAKAVGDTAADRYFSNIAADKAERAAAFQQALDQLR